MFQEASYGNTRKSSIIYGFENFVYFIFFSCFILLQNNWVQNLLSWIEHLLHFILYNNYLYMKFNIFWINMCYSYFKGTWLSLPPSFRPYTFLKSCPYAICKFIWHPHPPSHLALIQDHNP